MVVARQVERYVETKGSVICSRFVSVNFNGFWRLIDELKFEGLTIL